jgi:hypothetical protein
MQSDAAVITSLYFIRTKKQIGRGRMYLRTQRLSTRGAVLFEVLRHMTLVTFHPILLVEYFNGLFRQKSATVGDSISLAMTLST